MAPGPTNRVLTYLHRVALRQERGGLTDAQLLGRFLARRDEIAFEELVRRHGPMVLGVCRRVLGDPHDAADAFQATFLVLARRAASVVPRGRVGPWLYGVARRTALKARSSAARRRRAEQESARGRPLTTAPADTADDLRPLLDEELGRLPEKYRAPLVLCLLGAKSRKEAAGLLGWSEGTLSGRLARAKGLLAERLRRRGVAPAGVALSAALAESAAAAVPGPLARAAVKAAAHARPTPVIALTEEVMRAMLVPKLKAVAGVLVLAAAVGVGITAAARQSGPPARGADADSTVGAPRRETTEGKLPDYVIDPPDVLLVSYATRGVDDPVKIDGQRLVRPDGTISLGQLGCVSVSGRTLRQAHAAVAEHLASRLDGFNPEKLTVDVLAYNSKFIYVISEGAGGEQVYRLPVTGDVTVLDVLGGARVPLVGIGRKRVSVVRPSGDGKRSRVLSVDWEAITQRGEAATNYALFPGDRVYVRGAAVKPAGEARRAGAVAGAGPALVREFEAALKALREARSQEERRRVAEGLEVLTAKLREQWQVPRSAGRP